LTGYPHYTAANVMLPGVVADIYPFPFLPLPMDHDQQPLRIIYPKPLRYIPHPGFTTTDSVIKTDIVEEKETGATTKPPFIVATTKPSFIVAGGCGFCKNKNRTTTAWKSHLVEECIVLKRNVCDNCGQCGHTRSRCVA
jgi:hypothetical protein